MTEKKKELIKLIDKMIFWFVIVFLVSMTNSIFVNQIGYFGALILFGIRFVISRENTFRKTGLEFAFIIFLSAELISAILSVNHPQAFLYFFKRMVLIPIVYVVASSAENQETAKLFFKVYIFAALLTMIAYIAFAYEHFIAQLYRLESKGPSPFQYVMTAGGLMSFTTIFLFALLINERQKLLVRISYFAAFCISAIALFSSYTRAAWLGTIIGILVVLIAKRKYIFLALTAIVFCLLIFFLKSESKIYQYRISGNELVKQNVINTDGRATSIETSGDTLVVADYEKGVSVYADGKLIQRLETLSPATRIRKWKSNFYIAYLIDTRIDLLKKNPDGKLKVVETFTSKGLTRDIELFDEKFYTADEDSGLSIYYDPSDLMKKSTVRSLQGINRVNIDSKYFVFYNVDDKYLRVFDVKDGAPNKIVDSIKYVSSVAFLWVHNDQIYFQNSDKLIQYAIENGKLVHKVDFKIIGAFRILFINTTAIAVTMDGKVYKFDKIGDPNVSPYKIAQLNFSPTDFISDGNNIYLTTSKRNRLASLFDPYHETNYERLNIWQTGFKIWKDHPVFGVGDIDLGDYYRQYKAPYLKESFGHQHNIYVHFLVILGAIGFIAVMFLIAKILLLNAKIYKTLKNVPFVSSISLGALAMFIGFLFSGLGEWNFGDQEIITIVWFTVGLNIALYKAYLKNDTGGSKIDA